MNALEGVKVLDFTTLLPGPYATMILADLGAEVLKISAASRYDLVTGLEPFIEGSGVNANQAWLGRNKKNIFLNLKKEEGKEIVRRLVSKEGYNVIIEQFRPGVMDAMGLGYEELSKLCPGLIYCSLTGYGQTGPLRDAAGHDINYMSRSGIISHAGRAEEGPSLMDFQIADVAVGSMNSVSGILAALYHREKAGEGNYIDVAMLDGCVPFNSFSGAGFLVDGKEPKAEAEMLNGGNMYDYYRTADGRYMSVGALEPKFWKDFCTAIGREDLIKGTVWPKNTKEVKAQIREIFQTKTQAEWVEVFSHYDACVQPVMNLKEALCDDEQIRAREMVVDVPVPLGNAGTVRQMATPIKLSNCPCEYRHTGYPLGHHTEEVIRELGLDYDQLKAGGIFD